MNEEEIKNKIAKDLAYKINTMSEEFVKFLKDNNLEIDENGELVSKKKIVFKLFKKGKNK